MLNVCFCKVSGITHTFPSVSEVSYSFSSIERSVCEIILIGDFSYWFIDYFLGFYITDNTLLGRSEAPFYPSFGSGPVDSAASVTGLTAKAYPCK